MKKLLIILFVSGIALALTQCNKASFFSEDGYDERLTGGMATVFDETSKAFTHAVSGLDARQSKVHELGDAAFEQTFVAAPSPVNSGLGPIFNNVSCISCHHNDGKGTPTAGQPTSSLLVRLGIPGMDPHGGNLPVPGFGSQLQDQAILGKLPEATVTISYIEQQVSYPDGSVASLRIPTYTLANGYIPLPANLLTSPRMAPPVFGVGLLQNIPEATILGFADENDQNGDGISGRPNYVFNSRTGNMELGRFGLKANVSSLDIQVASAFNHDMGITNYLFPVESSAGQAQADQYLDDPELPDSILNYVTFYVQTLAVPARRNVTDPDVKLGGELFKQINCSGCHKPVIQTGPDLNVKALNNQRIQPFTDLLLHDMGDGLADGRPDFLATGREWRTAPLWGIGLFQKTNGTPFYLHDGRARTIEEAILWHGGEAENAKTNFMNLPATDRTRLIKFIQSL